MSDATLAIILGALGNSILPGINALQQQRANRLASEAKNHYAAQNRIFAEQLRRDHGSEALAQVYFPREAEPPPQIAVPRIRYWPMILFAAITWAGVALNFYTEPKLPPYYNLWRARGNSGNPNGGPMNCTADIEGSLLMNFADDYRAVLVCGVHDPLIADSDSRSIGISRPFDISNGPVLLAAPYTKAMMNTISAQIGLTGAPRGTRVEYLVSYFFYVALFAS